jgi:hypothetical protein
VWRLARRQVPVVMPEGQSLQQGGGLHILQRKALQAIEPEARQIGSALRGRRTRDQSPCAPRDGGNVSHSLYLAVQTISDSLKRFHMESPSNI